MMMEDKSRNNPFVVWAACILWLISVIAIVWSLILFFNVGDILIMSGIDIINAFLLLAGVMMLPTHISMLSSIANGKKINNKAKVLCCPLWLNIFWIITINLIAAIICAMRMSSCSNATTTYLKNSMKHYRTIPKHKHLVDKLQWLLKCCGYNSYKDWFSHDWYDKIQDYDWDPSLEKRHIVYKKTAEIGDSVPLSCCKSGSCISNYLTELGTYSINTDGCGNKMYRIVMSSLAVHLTIFLIIVILETVILHFLMNQENIVDDTENMDIKHIMFMKDNFNTSSGSCQLNPEDSDEVLSVKNRE